MRKKHPDPKKTDAAVPVTIVLATHSSDPEFDGDGDYAVVRLTPALIDLVRRRVEIARDAGHQDDDLYEIYFWSGTAEFYDCCLIDSCQEALAADGEQAAKDWLAGLERDGHVLVPAAVNLAACQPQRVDCNQMVVRRSASPDAPRFEIAWTASPKHTDVYVTTSDLLLTTLEEYVGKGRV